jgi:hypothetical protein
VNVESETGERGSQDVSPRLSPRLVENGIMSSTLSTIYPPPYFTIPFELPAVPASPFGLRRRFGTEARYGGHAGLPRHERAQWLVAP